MKIGAESTETTKEVQQKTEHSVIGEIQHEEYIEGKPSMLLFNNFELIKKNHMLGVATLSKALGIPQDNLRNFLIVNDIPVLN